MREAALEILSWACALLQSTTTRRAAAATTGKPSVAAPSLRSRPLQRIPARDKGNECPGLPHPKRQAPPGFHNLLTLRKAPRLPVLFHTGSAHGVHPSEHYPSHAAVHRLRAVTLMTLGRNRETPQTAPTSEEQAQRRKEQSKRDAIGGDPVFRVLLHVRDRHRRQRVRPPPARSSHGFPPLQGVPPRWISTAFTAPPLMRLSGTAQAPTQTLSRVSTPDEIGWSPKRLPTLLGFVAS